MATKTIAGKVVQSMTRVYDHPPNGPKRWPSLAKEKVLRADCAH